MASQISWLVREDDQSLSLTLYQHLPRHILNSKEPEEEQMKHTLPLIVIIPLLAFFI